MSHTTELFIMAAVWCVISAVVVRFVAPGWPGRIGLFAILVGVPFWELPYGYLNFQRYCRDEVGPKIFEPLLPQESICLDSLDVGLFRSLSTVGLNRIELTGESDDPKRDSKSGKVFVVKRPDIKSQYCLEFKSGVSLPWRITRTDTLIVRVHDRKIAVTQSLYQWAGMWWQVGARPVFGTGGICSDDPLRVLRLVKTGTGMMR
jgi:hypothetical protein